jgi:hypothetical protein
VGEERGGVTVDLLVGEDHRDIQEADVLVASLKAS